MQIPIFIKEKTSSKKPNVPKKKKTKTEHAKKYLYNLPSDSDRNVEFSKEVCQKLNGIDNHENNSIDVSSDPD